MYSVEGNDANVGSVQETSGVLSNAKLEKEYLLVGGDPIFDPHVLELFNLEWLR
jgi:hypothetical protein